MFGQEEINSKADKRGVVPPAAAQQIRALRAAEWWERYDSVVVGPGARDRSRGWFNSWSDLAAAANIKWFAGREGAGTAYTNQERERTDWAQDLYFTYVEMIAPSAPADVQTEANDASIMPILFAKDLAEQLVLTTVLAESDEISKAPANHYPAGVGTAYPMSDAAASSTLFPGTNGDPDKRNSWKWPEPIMLAAKSTMQVNGIIDSPLREALGNLPGPGFRRIPNNTGGFYEIPNWYVIKITFGGPRYLQLRGAREAA